jgi:transcriptional regulator with XRE-family HTH domain
MARVGKKIATLRRARGFSQDELGRRAGVTQAALSRIETGIYRQPRRGTLRRVARVLGCSIEYLSGPAPVVTEVDRGLQDVAKFYQGASEEQRRALLSMIRTLARERR